MAKRKPKSPTFNFVTLILTGMLSGLIGGVATHYLEPKGFTKEICIERIQKIGGPQYAIDYVCNGETFSFTKVN